MRGEGSSSGGSGGNALTPEAWEALLARLGSAGEYETMRRKLVKFFEWRGGRPAEDLADIVMDRVARRLAQGEAITELSAYFYSVARLVMLEGLRRESRQSGELPEQLAAAPPAALEGGGSGTLTACFEDCLAQQPPDLRRLILDYYEEDKSAKFDHRRQLAERLGIPINALRIRVCRIRAGLEDCIRRCEKRKER